VGEEVDLNDYGRAASHLRRLFETLGLERRQRVMCHRSASICARCRRTSMPKLRTRPMSDKQTLTPDITLSRALTDPGLFGNVFAGPSFWTWRVVAKLIDGLPLVEKREIDLFEQCTGRSTTGKHAVPFVV
jgi:hypothetical protein